MIYGYARVSTKGQARNGNSLEEQTKSLLDNGAAVVYSDAFSGKTLERPSFEKVLSLVQSGDTLMVTKLDRFARTTPEATALIRELIERGVKVHVLNMGVADNTPMGKLMVTILMAFAEYEREMIYERTQTGKAIARERGTLREGRPKKSPEGFEELCAKAASGLISVTEACKRLDISRSTWYNLARG